MNEGGGGGGCGGISLEKEFNSIKF